MKELESMNARKNNDPSSQQRSNSQVEGISQGAACPRETLDPPRVLSRIPDVTAVGPEEEYVRSSPSSGQGSVRARLSSAVLFGGAVILLAAALFTFNKKNGPDTSTATTAPHIQKTDGLESAAASTAMPRKWIGGTEDSNHQTLSRSPAFSPAGEAAVPTLNATGALDRRGVEPPRTAAWGGQPQWPIAGDPAVPTSQNPWNRAADTRDENNRAASTPWPAAAQTAADLDASWGTQRATGALPADYTWGKPSTAWNTTGSNRSVQEPPAQPITWNEPAQPPVAVPVQQAASAQPTNPVMASRASGWNTPTTYQTPSSASNSLQTPSDSKRTLPAYNVPQPGYHGTAVEPQRTNVPLGNASTGNYSTAAPAPGDYSAGNYSTGGYATGGYSTGNYSAGNYSTGSRSTGNYSTPNYSTPTYSTGNYSAGSNATNAYSNAASTAAQSNVPYPVTSSANGYQKATPVSNYSSGPASNGWQVNDNSAWGNRTTYPAAGNGAGIYATSPANGTSIQTAETGTAQFEGGIDKPAVRTTYDGTGSSIR